MNRGQCIWISKRYQELHYPHKKETELVKKYRKLFRNAPKEQQDAFYDRYNGGRR